MAAPPVDPKELQPAPPPASPPSAFLWTGLALLLIATSAGVGVIVQAGQSSRGLPQQGMLAAFMLFLCGVTLLFAQSRYLFWRQAAGIVEPHPLAPLSHRIYDPSERILQRGDAVLLFGLFLLALLPRWLAINHSLWMDELQTLEFYRHGPLYALSHQDGFNNHLLNSVLGSLTLEAFGMAQSSALPPAWMVRLPAFLFGTLSVPMLYMAAREAFGRSIGITAALLLAFSPFAVDVSAQARGYSALIFFTIAQVYFLCRALRHTSATAWIGWLFCSALGVLAHLYFVFVVGLTAIYVVIRALWRSAYLRSNPHAVALTEQAGVLLVAWAFLFCAEYIGVGNQILAELQQNSGTPPVARAHEIVLPTLQLWGSVAQGGMLTTYYVICGLLALLGCWYLIRQPSGAIAYIPLLLIVPFLVVEAVQPYYVTMRFFAFGLPLFLALIACGIAQTVTLIFGPQEQRKGWREGAMVVLAVAFCLLNVPALREVIRLPKQDYAGAAAAMRPNAGSVTIAAVGSGAKWLQQYGMVVKLPESEAAMRTLMQERSPLLVMDTDLPQNARRQVTPQAMLVQRTANRPERVFPGRFAGWPYRWLDGDSHIKLYRLEK